ncbi:hypothetical protein DUI87_10805 [Hirundo rustica rustica]|uniref:Uncharacterized protein n=1 Tax=Hirundo rustica rustica TaxID=333673 RepID=A0A3M0KKV1_HIRRU|nr:hypothetical protein DUI87_10805 [Hirundo rustica rustica]
MRNKDKAEALAQSLRFDITDDRPRGSQCPELEDHDCKNDQLPVDTETRRGEERRGERGEERRGEGEERGGGERGEEERGEERRGEERRGEERERGEEASDLHHKK